MLVWKREKQWTNWGAFAPGDVVPETVPAEVIDAWLRDGWIERREKAAKPAGRNK